MDQYSFPYLIMGFQTNYLKKNIRTKENGPWSSEKPKHVLMEVETLFYGIQCFECIPKVLIIKNWSLKCIFLILIQALKDRGKTFSYFTLHNILQKLNDALDNIENQGKTTWFMILHIYQLMNLSC